jgi:hypothetical protein
MPKVHDRVHNILPPVPILSQMSPIHPPTTSLFKIHSSMYYPWQRRKDFSPSLCVQTGSGVHPVSCTMGTRGPFPGAKARPRRDANHSPPSSAEVENE